METYKTIASRDGRNRIDFERTEDGFYRYVTLDDRYRDDPDFPNPPHWSLAEFSGLYDTAEAMEADARATFVWLDT
jgi:hypothetical protein